MPTQCIPPRVEFQGLFGRRVVGSFDGGRITSDAGALLLREVDLRRGIVRRAAACFTDHRDARRTEHSVRDLLAQRIYGLALGYEDVNDHDALRRDPLWGAAVGKADPAGGLRKRSRDAGSALAGKSTLNRLERTPESSLGRYHRITWDAEALSGVFADLYLDAHDVAPQEIILDLDATDDRLHGRQEGRFFHGYYDSYCYLPLYIFAGRHLLWAELRRSNIDGAEGALEAVRQLAQKIRSRWPQTRIVLRADSGFARDALMTWCEAHGVGFVFGLARNKRLTRMIEEDLAAVRTAARASGHAERRFRDLRYRTRETWSRARRVVAKAEYLLGERPRTNPRFVVTSLTQIEASSLYEDLYCARGEMENRIKEQQLDLFADRTSSATMRANQLRLWMSSLAYVLIEELRRLGLAATHLARARAGTIRLKLFKVGALVRVSVRRVAVAISSGYADAALFAEVLARVQEAEPT